MSPTATEFAWKRWRTGVAIALPAAVFLFVGVTVAFVWPEYWRAINYERSPLTWLSSVLLILIGLSGFSLFVLTADTPTGKRRGFLWLLWCAAFFFLSLDEFFQIHERLREGVFRPRGIGTNIPGIGPGDFLLIAYAIVGCAVLYGLLVFLRGDTLSLVMFACGTAIALAAIIMDATHTTAASDTLDMFRRMQCAEELLETTAQTLWLVALTRLVWNNLERRLT